MRSDKNNDDININSERIHLEMDSPLGSTPTPSIYPFISSILFHPRRMIRLLLPGLHFMKLPDRSDASARWVGGQPFSGLSSHELIARVGVLVIIIFPFDRGGVG